MLKGFALLFTKFVTCSLVVSVKMTVVRPFLETARGLGAIVNTDFSIKGGNPGTGAGLSLLEVSLR